MADEQIDLRFLGEQIKRLQSDLRVLKADGAQTRADLLRLEGDVAGIKADITRIEMPMDAFAERVDDRFDQIIELLKSSFKKLADEIDSLNEANRSAADDVPHALLRPSYPGERRAGGPSAVGAGFD